MTHIDWLKGHKPGIEISPLGEKVCNLLGLLYEGLYHFSGYSRVNWNDPYCIEVNVRLNEFATFDADRLTLLVFLAHEFCVRIELATSGPGLMKLFISERNRDGDTYHRHPTLDQAAENFHKKHDKSIRYLTGQEVNV